jgi:RimJ/RimL family protein N-acetyltransferase
MIHDHIVINNPEHGDRIARLSGAGGGLFNEKMDQVIARVKDGELLGGVIFDNYTRAAIGIHTAGFVRHWVNRDLIWMTFDYAFNQLGVRKIIGLVPSSNTDAIKFNTSAGFTIETTVADVYPDGDCLIFSLYKEDCRWLKLKPRGYVSNKGAHDGQA